MKRVLVIGSGGAGKSTLARGIADKTGLPLIHLDTEYWRPGWVETPTEEWAAKVEKLVAGDSWIIDGNYSSTFPLRMPRADTIILVERPRWRCLARVAKRKIKYFGRVRPDLAEGCPERFSLEFFKWVWGFPNRSQPRIQEAIAAHGAHATQIVIETDSASRMFLDTIDPKTD